MSVSLTPRQRETLRYVAGFIAAHQRAPSVMEIAKAIGQAKSAVFCTLQRAEQRGALEWRRGRGKRASEMRVLIDIALPRACDGALLFAARIGGGCD